MTTPFPFVAAQVLTASELNSITNLPSSTKTANYVLTIANVGSRVVMNAAGSTTITVNTSIFSAGDIVELSNIGAGVCTVTAGTATVSSAGPLAIPQYGGGRLVFTSASAAIYYPSAVTVAAPAASGLTLLSSGTQTNQATISLTNVFSTTYDFYQMRFSNFEMTGSNNETRLRFGSSGTADTGANYNIRGYNADTSLGPTATGAAQTSFKLTENFGTVDNCLWLDISAPFLAASTFVSATSFGNYDGAGGVGHGETGHLNTSTSYTDMFFFANSSNIGPFTYALFGYAK